MHNEQEDEQVQNTHIQVIFKKVKSTHSKSILQKKL